MAKNQQAPLHRRASRASSFSYSAGSSMSSEIPGSPVSMYSISAAWRSMTSRTLAEAGSTQELLADRAADHHRMSALPMAAGDRDGRFRLQKQIDCRERNGRMVHQGKQDRIAVAGHAHAGRAAERSAFPMHNPGFRRPEHPAGGHFDEACRVKSENGDHCRTAPRQDPGDFRQKRPAPKRQKRFGPPHAARLAGREYDARHVHWLSLPAASPADARREK